MIFLCSILEPVISEGGHVAEIPFVLAFSWYNRLVSIVVQSCNVLGAVHSFWTILY